MTLKNIVILVVIAAVGYIAYVKFVPQEKVNEAVGNATEVDHYTKGAAAFTGGLWDQVIEHYTAALKEAPDDERATEAEARVARAYEKTKQTDKAIAAYEAFIAKHPTNENVREFQKRVDVMKSLQ